MTIIYPVSGTMILFLLVVIAALGWSASNWLYDNAYLIMLLAMIAAIGIAIYHSFKRSKAGVNPGVAFVCSLISECSSMTYLLLCVWQLVDYILEDSLLGLIPVCVTAPFTFGGYGIIKVPSMIATSDASNTTSVCDAVITLAMVLFLGWLFKLGNYWSYLA